MSEADEGGAPPWRLRLLAGLLGVAAAALLALLIILVQRSTAQRDHALARTEHSFEVVLTVSRAQGAMARSEASLGRFVISSDPRFGTIYYDEWRHAGEELANLAGLVRDNPVQTRQVERLTALYLTRGRELALPATRASYRQGWPALSLYYRAARSRTLPAIIALLKQVAASESALLDRRATVAADRTDRTNSLTNLLSAVGIMLALLVSALAWLVAIALAERRLARESADDAADRALWLEQAVATRTAELSAANLRLEAEAATRADAERRLRQAQKMEAVGQLTGGIAHDFNNMLAVVMGSLELAQRRLRTAPAEAADLIASARNGAERAAALTRRLLAFARAQPLLPAAAEPGTLLRGMSDLLDRTLGARIEVRLLTDTDVWPVWIDAYQLENAILNLAVNGRDAMAGIGTLVMSVANTRLAEREVGELAAGDYVRLTVSDTGGGMTADVLERVFEPFFTTKPVGQGTGLGLSQILGFARQSGGDVAIASRPGQGTSVSILLPRYLAAEEREAPAQPAAPAPEQPVVPDLPAAPATAAASLVLLVEDDPRVRDAMAGALDELGYPVLLAGSGPEALARLADAPAVRLLMTDVIMPGMTGVDLARVVRKQRPDLPLLFVTGYTGEGDAEGLRDGVVLRKPFTLRALAAALAAALPAEAERAA